MADRSPAPDTRELRERWGGFEFIPRAMSAITPRFEEGLPPWLR